MGVVNIAGVPIGPDHPARISCELSCNHNGSLTSALRLIDECAEAGADFVKMQCYTLAEMSALRGDGPTPEPWASMGYPTLGDLYRKARTPHAWFPDLIERCEEVGVPWFSSVFGPDSLELLESLGCPAYKLSAWDNTEAGAPLPVRLTGKPIIASTRGTERWGWADLTLWCPAGYPQPWRDDEGFFTVGEYGIGDGCLTDGLSYHGCDPRVPLSAVVDELASMIEVHVQLPDEPGELDGTFSLTTEQLAWLCGKAARQ